MFVLQLQELQLNNYSCPRGLSLYNLGKRYFHQNLMRMEKFTFENLPEAVQLILEKLERMEKLLTDKQPEKPDSVESLDIQAASIFLGLAKATVYSKVCRGHIPAFKLGKKLLFNRSELEDYLEENKDQTNFHLKKAADEKLSGRFKKRIYTY